MERMIIDCPREYLVTQCLPENNQIVLAFGYCTYCCQSDMEKEMKWHKVTFKFEISSYRLKKEMPIDIEESILEDYEIHETWTLVDNDTINENLHLI